MNKLPPMGMASCPHQSGYPQTPPEISSEVMGKKSELAPPHHENSQHGYADQVHHEFQVSLLFKGRYLTTVVTRICLPSGGCRPFPA